MDRRALLRLARAGLVACVQRREPPAVPLDLDVPASGAFVTIHCRGELRGCLGTLDEREPLAEAVARLGSDVARNDYRFDPVRPDELADTELDISVLSPPQRVEDISEITIGRDGLIVEQGTRRGLLLPQVASEHGWDAETFLAHTCMKAGLPPDAWRRGATVWRFEAEVFSEREFGDRIGRS